MTHSRPTIHRLLDENRLSARRELGQNFVADPNTVRRIASLAEIGPGDTVFEIGSGLGSLTLALIETGADVVGIEIDPQLAALAAEIVEGKAKIIEADALTVQWEALLEDVDGRAVVVANLPYNVGTTIIIDILANVPKISSLLVMVQTEVADRLTAQVGSKSYGIPTVLVARHAVAEIVGRVPPSVFVPKPKVDSSLVRITRREKPLSDVAHDQLGRLVKLGFGQRRKMLRRSLAGVASTEQLESVGIEATQRAEQVSPEQWCRLALLTGEVAENGTEAVDG